MSWTDEKVEKLKELWGKKTASEIAQIIGNVSRNAIIGKVAVLGISKIVLPQAYRKIAITSKITNIKTYA